MEEIEVGFKTFCNCMTSLAIPETIIKGILDKEAL
jgi:hypothetical protein